MYIYIYVFTGIDFLGINIPQFPANHQHAKAEEVIMVRSESGPWGFNAKGIEAQVTHTKL